MNNTTKKRSFTLVEILVVLTIIGLVSSLIVVSLGSLKSKSRDTQRKTDLQQIYSALERYYEKFGKYPFADPYTGGCTSAYLCNPSGSYYDPKWQRAHCQGCGMIDICKSDSRDMNNFECRDFLKDLEEEDLIAESPKDPLNRNPYIYKYTNMDDYNSYVALTNSDQQFTLSAVLEKPKGMSDPDCAKVTTGASQIPVPFCLYLLSSKP